MFNSVPFHGEMSQPEEELTLNNYAAALMFSHLLISDQAVWGMYVYVLSNEGNHLDTGMR